MRSALPVTPRELVASAMHVIDSAVLKTDKKMVSSLTTPSLQLNEAAISPSISSIALKAKFNYKVYLTHLGL